jgi:MFS superfamily sulfate permease-like transporter
VLTSLTIQATSAPLQRKNRPENTAFRSRAPNLETVPDTTALDALLDAVKELQSHDITVAFARVRDQVRERMQLAGVEAAVGAENFHERVTDGVRAWQARQALR